MIIGIQSWFFELLFVACHIESYFNTTTEIYQVNNSSFPFHSRIVPRKRRTTNSSLFRIDFTDRLNAIFVSWRKYSMIKKKTMRIFIPWLSSSFKRYKNKNLTEIRCWNYLAKFPSIFFFFFFLHACCRWLLYMKRRKILATSCCFTWIKMQWYKYKLERFFVKGRCMVISLDMRRSLNHFKKFIIFDLEFETIQWQFLNIIKNVIRRSAAAVHQKKRGNCILTYNYERGYSKIFWKNSDHKPRL